MALSDIVRSIKKPESAIAALSLYLEKRDADYREPGWHPSDFAGMCARHQVIHKLLGIKVIPWKIDTKLQKIFDLGTAMHRLYQNEYFGEMDILWGQWVCPCEYITWGLKPRNFHCPKCGLKDKFLYGEVPVRKLTGFPEAPIVGKSDGLIFLGTGWAQLELKSINDRGFRATVAPAEGHSRQVGVYQELVQTGCVVGLPRGMEVPVPNGTLIIYMGKNTSEDKEFFTPCSPAEKAKAAEDVQQPRLYEEALRDRVLPPRVSTCSSIDDCRRASKCALNKQCFSGLSWEDLIKGGFK